MSDHNEATGTSVVEQVAEEEEEEKRSANERAAMQMGKMWEGGGGGGKKEEKEEAAKGSLASMWPQPPLPSRGLRVLLFGSKGWIGQQLCATLRERGHIPLAAACRADDRTAVISELMRVRPDRVISCIGRTHGPGCGTIDWLERRGRLKDNVRDNLYAPVILALACVSLGVHLTYLGTGCIYTYDEEAGVPVPTGHAKGSAAALAAEEGRHKPDKEEEQQEREGAAGGRKGKEREEEEEEEEDGKAERTFSERDQPNFFGSSYSTVKGYTDGIMQAISDLGLGVQDGTKKKKKERKEEEKGGEGDLQEGLVLTLRIRMPICGYHHPRDFITKLSKYERICSVPNR